jgi:hypothetical protein
VLAELFDEYLLAGSRVVAAVAGEVDYNADLIIPAVGYHPKRTVKQAARRARGRYKSLLADAKATPAPEPAELTAIKDELHQRAVQKSGRYQKNHPRSNAGEAESVYWAILESREIVSNDSDAHVLAAKHKLASSSFVEVSRHLVKAQKAVRPREIFKELATLASRGIFPGENITSELDLV